MQTKRIIETVVDTKPAGRTRLFMATTLHVRPALLVVALIMGETHTSGHSYIQRKPHGPGKKSLSRTTPGNQLLCQQSPVN